MRGDALARLGRESEARSAFQEEIRLFPKNMEAYARLAILYALEHRSFAEVREIFETMSRESPGRESALLAAKTLDSLGDHPAADAWRRRAGD